MTDSRDTRNPYRAILRSMKCGRRRRGPGFLSLLALLFIGLKLTGHIDWSWWWVLSPIWIKCSLLLLLIVGITIAMKRTGWKPKGET